MEEIISAPVLSNSGKVAAALKVNGNPEQGPSSSIWEPSSWTIKPIKQDVIYDDRAAVQKSLAKLERLPPLVSPAEINKLRESLKEVALGRAFLLQGGDCAELFDYCEQNTIESKIKLLLQMSLILTWAAEKTVVRIARMGGQYAKPRSSPMETFEGKQIHSFRGDILNGYAVEDRKPDPERLVSAYFHSAATLNFLRSSISSGFADLHSPLDWELGHVKDESVKGQYEEIVDRITGNLRFLKMVGADKTPDALKTVDLYTSHEALLLEYEQSLTRQLPHPPANDRSGSSPPRFGSHVNGHASGSHEKNSRGWYNTSAHFLWIGDRTRQITGAHIEYIRGIENPIGIKVGPTLEGQELVTLLDKVNPSKAVGKVTLITRYGEKRINDLLPAISKLSAKVVMLSFGSATPCMATPCLHHLASRQDSLLAS